MPSDTQDLGSGLRLRWSTSADSAGLASLAARVFNNRIRSRVIRTMRSGYPLMGPRDFALVEDTGMPASEPGVEGFEIVASTCLFNRVLEYDGVQYPVGQPEYVAVDERYRMKGLSKKLMEFVHEWSRERGNLVEIITGIPNYYRQYGYEFAMELPSPHFTYTAAIPPLTPGETEPVTFRVPTPSDVDDMMRLDCCYRSRGAVNLMVSSRAHYAYMLQGHYSPADPLDLESETLMVEVADGEDRRSIGFVVLRSKYDVNGTVKVAHVAMEEGLNVMALTPSFMRQVVEYGKKLRAQAAADANTMSEVSASPQENRDTEAVVPTITLAPSLTEINTIIWMIANPRLYPLYPALEDVYLHSHNKPYAMYVRVADIPGFLHHISSVLERRLAKSPLIGHTGELKISFFRDGVKINQ